MERKFDIKEILVIFISSMISAVVLIPMLLILFLLTPSIYSANIIYKKLDYNKPNARIITADRIDRIMEIPVDFIYDVTEKIFDKIFEIPFIKKLCQK